VKVASKAQRQTKPRSGLRSNEMGLEVFDVHNMTRC